MRIRDRGIEGANKLAREWSRVGNYYCCIWVALDCKAEYAFSHDDIDAVQSLEFIDWCLELDMESAAYEKSKEVREWRPVCKA